MYYSDRGSTPTVVVAALGGVCKSAPSLSPLPRRRLPACKRIADGNFGRNPETVKPPPLPAQNPQPEISAKNPKPRNRQLQNLKTPKTTVTGPGKAVLLIFIFTSPVLTLRGPGSIELPCTVITSRPSTEFE